MRTFLWSSPVFFWITPSISESWIFFKKFKTESGKVFLSFLFFLELFSESFFYFFKILISTVFFQMLSISFYFAQNKAGSWILGSNFFRLFKQKRIITAKKTIPCLFQKATLSIYIKKVWDGVLVEQGTKLDTFPWNMSQPEYYSIRWKGVSAYYDTNKNF